MINQVLNNYYFLKSKYIPMPTAKRKLKDRNVVVLGMAIEDVAAVNDFLKETKVSYPLFAADIQGMEIASQLGNNKGVLPYTVIINADGSIVKSFFGRVTKPLLEKLLLLLLQK